MRVDHGRDSIVGTNVAQSSAGWNVVGVLGRADADRDGQGACGF